MRNRVRAVVILATMLGWHAVASGHHSVNGQFDMTKTITLRGTIAKVDWINPHPYVTLTAADETGGATTWALSTIPLAMLRKAGITRESLRGRPGEVVTVVANPALGGRPLAWIARITYADGRYYALFE